MQKLKGFSPSIPMGGRGNMTITTVTGKSEVCCPGLSSVPGRCSHSTWTGGQRTDEEHGHHSYPSREGQGHVGHQRRS